MIVADASHIQKESKINITALCNTLSLNWDDSTSKVFIELFNVI